ncbi:Mycothiol acetyltransferase [Methylobacterium adhaesivum]|jgi:ribosomal-protein-alanine N-acetyltransferase|uniref:GNAT family N-acetyltransferase n=1 Tax=Methylobacterium adhaesivum TaxID=333297 RepID=A0ABT8BLY1_9HYPH|nr:GNAT family N-acetyltransferase [Methylobacterium adhaesivum]MDN3592784.1 GNAT family N-acetyltransferase [Methylobacterium adhaesivum]GJD29419.1 Mycothiol acetyltransferase [Methylobacterium adhaesivum]
MTRPLAPFWPFELWSAWWEGWGGAPYVAVLRDSGQARVLARLHATAFARPWDAHEFERMLCERSTEAHALWKGGAIQGFVLSRRVADEAEILTVVLSPSLRGNGLSRQLVADHLAHLTLSGVRRVHLEVDEGNTPALKLYARHGFRQVGERTGYYARADGSRATALTMTAELA